MEKNGNEETKNNDTALNVAQKTRGTAPAGRAWDPVCGAFAGGPCLCGRRLGVENAALPNFHLPRCDHVGGPIPYLHEILAPFPQILTH